MLACAQSFAAEIVLKLGPGGAAALVNSSLDTSIVLKSYSITRRDQGVELWPAGWHSFHLQGELFAETSATVDLLAEATVAAGLLIAPGQSRSIGVPFYLRADADANGAVDLTDFAIWKSHQGQSLQGPSVGDFDLNGVVDLDDFEILVNEMGNSAVYTFAATTAVSEPAGSLLAVGGLGTLILRRKRLRARTRNHTVLQSRV
jgi:hypothetical protein